MLLLTLAARRDRRRVQYLSCQVSPLCLWSGTRSLAASPPSGRLGKKPAATIVAANGVGPSTTRC